jgi:hypothetical protein
MSRLRALLTLLLIGAGWLVAGCETLPDGKLGELVFGSGDRAMQLEEEHRERYQETRKPDDRDWLLGHAVESGMTPTQVTRVLGQEGERVANDAWIKNGDGHYQIDDQAWKWGPDSEGQSVFLVFRDSKLVNFDPHEFR